MWDMLLKTVSLLLPVLFPSWRFFKTVGPSPRVEYRLMSGCQTTDWQESRPLPAQVSFPQMLLRMFWNPERNTQLYMVSLSERLVSGVTEHSVDELNRLIAERLADHSGDLQFRLMFLLAEGEQIVGEVLYESTPVPLAEVAP